MFFHRIDKNLRKEAKYAYLAGHRAISGVKWEQLKPDERNTWIAAAHGAEFSRMMPIGSKEAKAAESPNPEAMFKAYTLGIASHRDSVVLDFSRTALGGRVKRFVDDYNGEVDRYKRAGNPSAP